MILLVGASASGKTEIAKYLQAHCSIKKVVTHTTRPMRPGEKEGVDYHFVSLSAFQEMERQGDFVETTEYNGNRYGSSKAEVGDDKVLIVDPSGLASFLALKDPRILTFYLEASEETRKERMLQRGDGEEAAEKRIANDRIAFEKKKITGIDFTLSTDKRSIESLAQEIYVDYQKRLSQL